MTHTVTYTGFDEETGYFGYEVECCDGCGTELGDPNDHCDEDCKLEREARAREVQLKRDRTELVHLGKEQDDIPF